MHQYITIMKEHEFVLWVIGAKAEQKGKFVYDLPDNVTEIHEVFLDDALKIREKRVYGMYVFRRKRNVRWEK